MQELDTALTLKTFVGAQKQLIDCLIANLFLHEGYVSLAPEDVNNACASLQIAPFSEPIIQTVMSTYLRLGLVGTGSKDKHGDFFVRVNGKTAIVTGDNKHRLSIAEAFVERGVAIERFCPVTQTVLRTPVKSSEHYEARIAELEQKLAIAECDNRLLRNQLQSISTLVDDARKIYDKFVKELTFGG